MASAPREFPNWLVLEVQVGSPEDVRRSLHASEALWRALAALPWARHCSYMPVPSMAQILFQIAPESGGATEERLGAMRDLVAGASVPEGHRGTSAYPFASMPMPAFGDAAFCDVLSAVHHAGSEAYFSFHGSPAAGFSRTFLFSIASTLSLFDAAEMSAGERASALERELEILREATHAGPGTQAWDESVALMRERYSHLADAVRGLRLDPERAPGHFSPEELAILRKQASAFEDAIRPFPREACRAWRLPFEHFFVKRLLHGLWLRAFMDNYKESICLGWLLQTSGRTAAR
jgi:hypothetical protein